MPLSREELPRFTAAAVCRGSRKEQIVLDLTDAGVTQQAAQRMVDEIMRIHQELRAEGAEGLEEKVRQAWLNRGAPLEFATATQPTSSRPGRALGDRAVLSGGALTVGVLTIVYGVVLCLFWGSLWASALSGDKPGVLQVETAAGALAILVCTLVPVMLIVTGAALCWPRADNSRGARATVVVTLVTAALLGAKAALIWYCLEARSPPSGSSANSFGFLSLVGVILEAVVSLVVFAVVIVPSAAWAVVLAVTGIVEFAVQGRRRQAGNETKEGE
jgi:hypothetical protein